MAIDLRIVAAIASTLAVVAVVAATGCGGGSDEVSAEELVQQGDEVCDKVRERFAELQAEPPPSATAGAAQAGELLGVADDAQEELREIEPPEELGDRYEAYLDARESVSEALERGERAAEDQDGEAYGAAQEEAVGGAPERRRLARELGFKVCSQSAEAP